MQQGFCARVREHFGFYWFKRLCMIPLGWNFRILKYISSDSHLGHFEYIRRSHPPFSRTSLAPHLGISACSTFWTGINACGGDWLMLLHTWLPPVAFPGWYLYRLAVCHTHRPDHAIVYQMRSLGPSHTSLSHLHTTFVFSTLTGVMFDVFKHTCRRLFIIIGFAL